MGKSFFQRLTGTSSEDSYEDEYQEDSTFSDVMPSSDEINLPVDIYQTPDSIVLKAFTPGVLPSSVSLSLTRDMLTIHADRSNESEVNDEAFSARELDWRSMKRTVLLPSEVDIDLAEATESHGVLTIRMPKINKDRETKIRVKAR